MNEHFLKIENKDIISNLVSLSQLVFEVTDVCNLRCKYCGYGELYEDHDQWLNTNLPTKSAKLFLDY